MDMIYLFISETKLLKEDNETEFLSLLYQSKILLEFLYRLLHIKNSCLIDEAYPSKVLARKSVFIDLILLT